MLTVPIYFLSQSTITILLSLYATTNPIVPVTLQYQWESRAQTLNSMTITICYSDPIVANAICIMLIWCQCNQRLHASSVYRCCKYYYKAADWREADWLQHGLWGFYNCYWGCSKRYQHWHYNFYNQLHFSTWTKFIITLKKHVFLEGSTSDIFRRYLILEVRGAERKIHVLMLVNKIMVCVVPYTVLTFVCLIEYLDWLVWKRIDITYICQYGDARMGKQLCHLLSLGKCLF